MKRVEIGKARRSMPFSAAAIMKKIDPISVREHGWQACVLPGAQPLDIAFAWSQMLEKGHDDFSRAAMTQYDIRGFYDSMDLQRAIA